MFGTEFSPRANRDLDRLPEKIGFACLEFIHGPLSENPSWVGKPLIGLLAGQYSARRGSCRVVYRIDDERTMVVINRIDHRADVYRS